MVGYHVADATKTAFGVSGMTIPGNVRLFANITAQELEKLLSCLSIRRRSYFRGETILREGDPLDSIGLVLFGRIQILRNEYDGSRSIVSTFGTGAVFAETFVCAGETVCPVTVTASENSEILFIPYARMIRSCGNTCGFHTQLIENMMRLLAEKNLHLNAKLQIASKRTIRDRVMRYLHTISRETGATNVTIPFSRSDLADYLYVDRSALSRELGRMEADGLIRIDGRSFQIVWR